MGWCSATEIMDRVVAAAETSIKDLASGLGEQVNIDAVLSPIVSDLAEHLRDGDWDCIEDSAYFDRFDREMLGHEDDAEYQKYLYDQLMDTEPNDFGFPILVAKLADITKRIEATEHGAG